MLKDLNPITKFIWLTAITIIVFETKSTILLVYIIIVLFTLILFYWKELGKLKYIFLPIMLGLPTTVIIFILSYFYEGDSFTAAVYRGFIDATRFIIKINILVFCNLLFVVTTDLRQFTLILHRLKVPNVIIVMISTATRYLPLLISEARHIIEVQKMRGFKIKKLYLPKHWLMIVLPFFMITIQKSNDMAISIYLRGSSALKARKIFFGLYDYLGLLLLTILLLYYFIYIK